MTVSQAKCQTFLKCPIFKKWLAALIIDAYSKQALVDPSWRVYPGTKSTEHFAFALFKPVKVKD